MAYTLDGLVLPKPKSFVRDLVEQSVEHLLMFGKTTKRVTNRKERFVLQYVYLTPAQVNSITSKYLLDMPLIFTVDEGNLNIPATEVLMDLHVVNYPPSGKRWLQNMKVTLIEVI